MNVMVDLCVVPMGVGVSVSRYVAACQHVLEEAGLAHQLHAYGTNVEGEWDAVFAAVKRCHEVVHAMGAPRIFTTLRVGTRMDREQHMQDKVDSVCRELGQFQFPDESAFTFHPGEPYRKKNGESTSDKCK